VRSVKFQFDLISCIRYNLQCQQQCASNHMTLEYRLIITMLEFQMQRIITKQHSNCLRWSIQCARLPKTILLLVTVVVVKCSVYLKCRFKHVYLITLFSRCFFYILCLIMLVKASLDTVFYWRYRNYLYTF